LAERMVVIVYPTGGNSQSDLKDALLCASGEQV